MWKIGVIYYLSVNRTPQGCHWEFLFLWGGGKNVYFLGKNLIMYYRSVNSSRSMCHIPKCVRTYRLSVFVVCHWRNLPISPTLSDLLAKLFIQFFYSLMLIGSVMIPCSGFHHLYFLFFSFSRSCTVPRDLVILLIFWLCFISIAHFFF